MYMIIFVILLKMLLLQVTHAVYHSREDTVVTASPDETVRIWNVDKSKLTFTMHHHDGPVTGISLHPTGDYLLSSSLDHCWAFSDITAGRLLTKVSCLFKFNSMEIF